MTIAITGATGFVGQAVSDLALTQGLELRALARKPQAERTGVEWIVGNLHDTAALARLMHGAEAVLHVAGLTTAPDAASFEHGNVTGTLNVIEAAQAAGVPRFICVSSLAAREPELSLYGASKLRAERLVRASPLDWTIVRPPTVYGPRDRDMLELFRMARWGVIATPNEGRSSIIHATDLARLLLVLLPGSDMVTHQTFEPDDGRERGWSHYELARALGWAMGRRPHVLALSKTTMQRAARLDGFFRRGKARLTLDRVGYMSHPDWVADAAAKVPAALWQPQIETREGLKATVAWYREQGLL